MKRRYGFTLPELMIGVAISTLIFAVIVALLITSMRIWRKASTISKDYPQAFVITNRITDELMSAAYIRLPPMWASATSYSQNNVVICRFDVVDPTDTSGRIKSVYETYKCLVTHTSSTSNQPVVTGASTYWTPSYPWIIIYRPTKDTNGLNITPMVADLTGVIQYYLGNSDGTASATGTYLWKRRFTQNSNNTITQTSNKYVANNVSDISFYAERTSTNQILTVNSLAISYLGQEKSTKNTSTFREGISFRNPLISSIPSMPIIP
ncbi:MAG: prepilin-type N-terminal cleavage/methylation domain-containing protein [bacterium]